MNIAEASRIVESLRKGLPPTGYVRDYTVGRQEEIECLEERLRSGTTGALLLKANYGSGKSHLLKLIRELALEHDFLVSYVTLDAKSGVRFNRMDQILGAIWRNIEIPQMTEKGLSAFFDFACGMISLQPKSLFSMKVSDNHRWQYADVFNSPATFVALRAWILGDARTREVIEGWLYEPSVYKGQRKLLYHELVGKLQGHFLDRRPEWMFYKQDVFLFDRDDYAHAWGMLRDIQTIARDCGKRGLVVLFDEFEDVLSNLRNVAHQESAFWNLFRFFGGKEFTGCSFFAVTPEFVHKCKARLREKQRWHYDDSQFDKLPSFEMTPLALDQLECLAERIIEVHQVALAWDSGLANDGLDLRQLVAKTAAVPVQDRTRATIKAVVEYLDDRFDDSQ